MNMFTNQTQIVAASYLTLREARTLMGVPVRQLAKEMGIPLSTYTRLEAHKRNPTLQERQKIEAWYERNLYVDETGNNLFPSKLNVKTTGFVPPKGYTLAALRKYMGYDQETLAELMGVHIDTVRAWEQHRNSPSQSHYLKLLDLFKEPLLTRLQENKSHIIDELIWRNANDQWTFGGDTTWFFNLVHSEKPDSELPKIVRVYRKFIQPYKEATNAAYAEPTSGLNLIFEPSEGTDLEASDLEDAAIF